MTLIYEFKQVVYILISGIRSFF